MKKFIILIILSGLFVVAILFWIGKLPFSSESVEFERKRQVVSIETDSEMTSLASFDVVGFMTVLDESSDRKLLEIWRDRDGTFNGLLKRLDEDVNAHLARSGFSVGGTLRVLERMESPPKAREYVARRFHVMLALLRPDRPMLLEQVFEEEVSNPSSEHVLFLAALESAFGFGDFKGAQFFDYERIAILARTRSLQSQYLALDLLKRGNGGDPIKILSLLDENPWLENALLKEFVASVRVMVVKRTEH